MDEVKINKVVKDLVADYDRLDGNLSMVHFDRLVEKRMLSIEDIVEVYRQLCELGISIKDEQSDYEDKLTFDDGDDGVHLKHAEHVGDNFEVRIRKQGIKLLTAEEECEFGRRIELGRRAVCELKSGVLHSEEHDRIIERAKSAKEVMVLANLRLVLHIAKSFIGRSDLSLEDLFQEGVVGLMRGIDRYNYKLGFKFSTYATWWIRQSIMRAMADRGVTIRLPAYINDDIIRLKRAIKLQKQEHPDRPINLVEVAKELNWTTDKVHFIQQSATIDRVSLDDVISGHDDLKLSETLVSDIPSPEDDLWRVEMTRCINDLLDDLDPRQRAILCLRFGLDGSRKGATLEEVGKLFGLTRERIRQIENMALDRLRKPIRANLLRHFI